MKLKDGFVLRNVAGQIVVLPSGDDFDLNMVITLNETGKFIWQLLEDDISQEEIVSAILKEFDVDTDQAQAAVSDFIRKLNNYGFLEN